jgi:hypothetical protein
MCECPFTLHGAERAIPFGNAKERSTNYTHFILFSVSKGWLSSYCLILNVLWQDLVAAVIRTKKNMSVWHGFWLLALTHQCVKTVNPGLHPPPQFQVLLSSIFPSPPSGGKVIWGWRLTDLASLT